MKTDFFKIDVVAAMLFSTVQLSAQNRDWAQHGRYAQANKELSAPAKGEHRVVFMGNSITDHWANMRPDFFIANNYIGRGISGQTSYQFLLRFREDVINLKPEVVVINAGTNDCAENTHAFNPEITLGNVMSMVELAKANGIKVVIASTLPATTFGWNPAIKDAPERVKTINKLIKDYADANKIPYVDYYSAMVAGPDGTMNPAYSNDGVHPTHAGYEVMEPIVKAVIDKTLRRKK